MHGFSVKSSSRSGVARALSAALGLFLLSTLTLPTGCMSRSLTGLSIEPASGLTCIYPGATAQYHAYGTYTEGGHAASTKDITDSVTWSVTFPSLASINSSGLLTAGTVAVGTSDIVASTEGEFGFLDATSNVQVSTSCVSSSGASKPALNIVPAVSTLSMIGDIERPLAIAVSATEPRVTDVTTHVTWHSANPAIATVNAVGLIAAVGPGKTTITAEQKLPDGSVISGTQTVEVASGSPTE